MTGRRRSRRLLAVVALGGVAAASLAVVEERIGSTTGSWVDAEHVAGDVGVVDCADSDNYVSAGAGRFLAGDVVGLDLDAVAAAAGLDVHHDGGVATPTPATATNVGVDAFVSDLDVALLGA